MNKMKNRIIVTLLIIICLLSLCLVNEITYNKNDVNRDGEVNSLDLLIVQKEILKEMLLKEDK